jgi:NADH:ubiquinone oxidoreductase subunit E
MTRKHPCPDCACCLECSEARCRVCRGVVCEKRGRKLSVAEQIRLYERINAEDRERNGTFPLKEERG